MRLPIYNSVTMGMGWGLFLLVQTPRSAQRSHDRRVVIGASDMGWGNLSPTPFSLASIDCLHPSDKETVQKQSAEHPLWGGVGEGGGGRKERELGSDGFTLLKPQGRVKITSVGVFFLSLNCRVCVEMKYLMKNSSQPLPQSILDSTTFVEDATSLTALKIK